MPGWAESRILLLEKRVEDLARRLQDLTDQLKALSDSTRANTQQMPTGGGGGGGPEWTLYTCTVPSAVTGPGATFTATVAPVMGPGAPATVTIGVGIPGPTVAGKMGYVVGDGGGYWLIAQSCT